MTKRTYVRTDGEDIYPHTAASIAYRRLSGPTIWVDEEDGPSDLSVAFGVLVLIGVLGFIGWLCTIT
jgi:hypothetical protein